METITSRHNPLIIEMTKLSLKKHRDAAGLFLFEGRKLFIEAKTSSIDIRYVFVTDDYYKTYAGELSGYSVFLLSSGCFEKISTEKSPEGIICAAGYIDFLHFYIKIDNISKDLCVNNKGLCFFLVSGIQDPGNLGTIIRTANALGVNCLITDRDCADFYHTRTIRATMGALFRQRIAVSDDMTAVVRYLKEIGFDIYAAEPDRSALRLDSLAITEKTCFLVGNEGHGLDHSLMAETSGRVFIPMEKDAESLNASVAAGLLMWESYKQRKN